MPDIKLSIDDLPPATTVYNADVFVIDQLGSDGYSKKLTYQILKNTLGADVFVLRAGDTMTGALILNTSTPALPLQAAPKAYVDTFLSKAGGTMTGNLILNTSTPTNALQATSRAYVQNNFLPISGIGTGEQNTGMTGFLTLCAHPISAFHAATKYYVDNRSGDGSPVGSVVYFAASAAPVGWFECNGAILDKTIYADLFNAIGYKFGGSGNQFLLPDLRGEFIRGWDDGRGVDAGRSFGSSQLDDFKSHNHATTNSGGFRENTYLRSTSPDGAPALASFNIFGTSLNVPTVATGGTETRPRNVALLPCIKYATNAAVNYLGLSAQDVLNYVNSLSASLSAQIPDPKSVAKAWITFTGQAVPPGRPAFYNIASVTYNGAGSYTFAFTNALTDANYGIFIGDNYNNSSVANRRTLSQTTTNFTVLFSDGGGTYTPPLGYIVIFGN